MRKLLLVFFGGGFGSGARYLFGAWAAQAFGPAFPYGTIAINALGSFLIALIMEVSLTTRLVGPDLRLALTTGVMGGFTTYSTFNYETLGLFRQGAWLLGCANLAVTVVLCLLLGALGFLAGRAVAGS